MSNLSAMPPSLQALAATAPALAIALTDERNLNGLVKRALDSQSRHGDGIIPDADSAAWVKS